MVYTFQRYNNMGLMYLISEEGDKTRITCNGKTIIVDQKADTISSCWYQWQMNGKAIQVAFPMLNGAEREFLLTGITSEEWKEIFDVLEN